jgi:transmembrane sensor
VTAQGNHSPNATAATEATEWFVSLHGSNVSIEMRQAFAEWLRRSPIHIEEFLRVTALHGDLRCLAELENLDVDKLLLNVDLRNVDDNLIPLSNFHELAEAGFDTPLRNGDAPRRRRLGIRSSIVLIIAITFVVVGMWLFEAPAMLEKPEERYRTAVGEQLSATLADGSHMELNARSNLRATVSKDVRELHLEDGEALFRVAKNPTLPFRVYTSQATIEAKGTQFDIDASGGATVVSLIEGHVLVTTPASAITLNPGEQVSIPAHSSNVLTAHAVAMKSVIAWTEHRLVFEDAPLSSVVVQFNRYSLRPFAIEDSSIRELRITGSFNSEDTESFADSLSAAGALQVTLQGGVYRIGPR